ncbi:hypothetical protein [Caudoviricetes sp.]|nr:hypothetical protein [Caudoviricetes sp.]
MMPNFMRTCWTSTRTPASPSVVVSVRISFGPRRPAPPSPSRPSVAIGNLGVPTLSRSLRKQRMRSIS